MKFDITQMIDRTANSETPDAESSDKAGTAKSPRNSVSAQQTESEGQSSVPTDSSLPDTEKNKTRGRIMAFFRPDGHASIRITAAAMFIFTIVFGHDSGIGSLLFNSAFLLIMVMIIMAGFHRSLDPMSITSQEMEDQLRVINDLCDQYVVGLNRRDPRYRPRVNRLWVEICSRIFCFTDKNVSDKWKLYTQSGIGNEALLETGDAMLERYNAGFSNMIPGFLTGLGILGTFFGLVMSLDSFSISAIENSIGNIISGMNVAFFTSIYGVIFSILYNYFNWNIQQNLSDHVSRLRDLLHGLFDGAAGDTAMEKLIEMERRCSEEVTAIRTSLSGDIGKEVGIQVGRALAPEFSEINSTLGNVVGQFNLEQNRALENITKQFIQKVTSGLNSHINTLGSSVDRLSTSQDQMTAEMRKLLEEMEHSLVDARGVNADSDQLLVKFADYLARIDAITAANEETIRAVEQISQAVNDMQEVVMKMIREQQKTDLSCQHMIAAIQGQEEAVRTQNEILQSSMENMYQLLEKVLEGTAAARSVSTNEKLERLIDAMEENNRLLGNRGIHCLIRRIISLSDRRNRRAADEE